MKKLPKYNQKMPWKLREKVWFSIPVELREMCLFCPLDGYHISSHTEHLLHAWLTGGKARYEKGKNPIKKPRYRKPPPLHL